MKRFRPYLGALLLVAVLAGVVVFAVVGNRTPTAKVKLDGGEEAEVTPIDKMRVRTAEGQPKIDITTYRLRVTGLVDKPLSLSFSDIKSMNASERLVKLPCVEGWTERAVWKGPRLTDMLDKAGVRDEAETVVFSSPGGYTTSLTVEDVRETDPFLAYEVNGRRLPDDQGYPLRLVVPNRLGYKWIKWVDEIKPVKGGYLGYWESRGYSNEADATGR